MTKINVRIIRDKKVLLSFAGTAKSLLLILRARIARRRPDYILMAAKE